MQRSGVTILLSLFLGCLTYQFFIHYKPYIPAISMDSLGVWIVVIICALVPALAVLAVAITSRSKSTHRPPKRLAAQLPKPIHKEEKVSRQLIEMLNGDQGAAQWLFYTSKQNNPDRDVVWNLEKVIYELVRDRAMHPNAPLPQAPSQRGQQPKQQPAAQSSPPRSKPIIPPPERDYRDYRDN